MSDCMSIILSFIVSSCTIAFSPLSARFSTVLILESTKLNVPFLLLIDSHFISKLSILIMILPISLVPSIFLDFISSLLDCILPFWSSISSSFFWYSPISFVIVILCVFFSFIYVAVLTLTSSLSLLRSSRPFCSFLLDSDKVLYLLTISFSSLNSSWFCSLTILRKFSYSFIASTLFLNPIAFLNELIVLSIKVVNRSLASFDFLLFIVLPFLSFLFLHFVLLQVLGELDETFLNF
mmetsp:Transcript_30891/g.35286  ORF Transcript_30891/g.35286 Transcript_30891/m.35286 type:complete len:237 (-) Transcript_30891:196-906(-)